MELLSKQALCRSLFAVLAFAGCLQAQTLKQIVTIDLPEPKGDGALGSYPLEACRYNHGMAIDSEHHRALLLCGGTKTLTVFALDTRKAIAHLPLPAGPTS